MNHRDCTIVRAFKRAGYAYAAEVPSAARTNADWLSWSRMKLSIMSRDEQILSRNI